jgi:tRNA threonylcarbamoyladenosine biosynthesis protein TsaB
VTVVAFDTATADTVVGLQVPGAPGRTARHVPAPGERPGHAAQLLGLARGLLEDAGLGWRDVTRIGVGTGPGTFTGLRIGVATARALVQAGGQELVGVSTLEALARAAAADPATPPGAAVLACLDARRGEAYAAAWRGGASLPGGTRALAPAALGAVLAAAPGPWVAAGDGSVRFRAQLEAAGAHVWPDGSALHHVDGTRLCELALEAAPAGRDALEPEYVRAPDAVPSHLR